MCAVSMIGDHYSDRFRERWPQVDPWPLLPQPYAPSDPADIQKKMQELLGPKQITREEFDQLKREVLEMKELLRKAKAYDEAKGEPDCELESKLAVLRKVAALVGVNLDDVLKPSPPA